MVVEGLLWVPTKNGDCEIEVCGKFQSKLELTAQEPGSIGSSAKTCQHFSREDEGVSVKQVGDNGIASLM